MPAHNGVPRLVIASVGSGAGKTTVALGLVGALRRRGRAVQTFKVGPDLVDSAYLARASHRPCRTLDSWMLGSAGVSRSFAAVTDADCAVIEGTMGIFDVHGTVPPGGDPLAFPGSTAELARLTGAPIVLVVDIGVTAETAGALVLGVRHLDPSLDVIGVVLNNVPSGHRREAAEEAVWRWARLPVLGALPRLEAVQIPEVRTGLLPITQNPYVDSALDALTSAAEKNLDVDLIEKLMRRVAVPSASRHTRPAAVPAPRVVATPAPRQRDVRVGVAFDDAFCFYYAENLELLEAAGASVVTFSPLEERALPPDLDAIYLGGGVAEKFVPQLSSNHSFMASLRRVQARGLPLYAECGGAMYLARTLRTSDGLVHGMAGLVPVDLALEADLCHTGYRELRLRHDTILGTAGTVLRAHEFHHCSVLAGPSTLKPAYSVHDADGDPRGCEGWVSPSLLASLMHLHFGQEPAPAQRLVAAARAAQDSRARGQSISA